MLAQNVGRMGVRGSTALGWQLQPFGCPWVGGIWPCSWGWEDAEPPPALSWHVGLLSFVLGGPGSQACFWDVWVSYPQVRPQCLGNRDAWVQQTLRQHPGATRWFPRAQVMEVIITHSPGWLVVHSCWTQPCSAPKLMSS